MIISKEKKDRYYKYLRSKQWADIKLDLIQTRGAQCERCGAKRKQLRYLHVHHLTYKNLFNEEPEDLEILCAPCHRAEHNIGKKRKRDKKKKPKVKKIKLTKKQKKIRAEMNASRKSQNRFGKRGGYFL